MALATLLLLLAACELGGAAAPTWARRLDGDGPFELRAGRALLSIDVVAVETRENCTQYDSEVGMFDDPDCLHWETVTEFETARRVFLRVDLTDGAWTVLADADDGSEAALARTHTVIRHEDGRLLLVPHDGGAAERHGGVEAMALAPDGDLLYTLEGGAVVARELAAGTRRVIHDGPALRLVATDFGGAALTDAGDVIAWQREDRAPVVLDRQAAAPLVAGPGAIAWQNGEGALAAWSPGRGSRPLRTDLRPLAQPTRVAASADGRVVLIGSAAALRWDGPGGRGAAGEEIRASHLLTDGHLLLLGALDGGPDGLWVVAPDGGRSLAFEEASQLFAAGPDAAAVVASGRLFHVSAGADGLVSREVTAGPARWVLMDRASGALWWIGEGDEACSFDPPTGTVRRGAPAPAVRAHAALDPAAPRLVQADTGGDLYVLESGAADDLVWRRVGAPRAAALLDAPVAGDDGVGPAPP